MEQSSAAEQRASAVAKLKRAASLPRMKDGRRPPMHVEAVSEGEKSQVDEKNGDEKIEANVLPENAAQPQDQVTIWPELQEKEVVSVELDEEPMMDDFIQDSVVEKESDTPPAQKKRRRSRSRGRGSKDMKAMMKAVASSSLHVSLNGNESSPDEDVLLAAAPPVMSPRPARFDTQTSRFESPMYPGTTPSTPVLPSLEALQKGLFRSNSASSGVQRMMAMAKLTGEIFDPATMSPPPMGKLTRNNTVAGGERNDRMAARALLFHRLGERMNTDAEQTSGGEDSNVRAPTSMKRKKRRSRRNSSRASTVVDDREPPSTTPTTPLPPSPTVTMTLLPSNNIPEPVPPPPPLHLQIPAEDSFEYQTPLDRRGVVIEDEDDVPELGPALPVSLSQPQTPNRTLQNLYGGKIPHLSDLSSNFSSNSDPVVGSPVFLSHKHIMKGNPFPTSPFATPLKEKAYLEDEDEPVTYEESRRELRTDPFNREISWIAELVPESRMPINDDDDDDNDDEAHELEHEHEHEHQHEQQHEQEQKHEQEHQHDNDEDEEHEGNEDDEHDGDDEGDVQELSHKREISQPSPSPHSSPEPSDLHLPISPASAAMSHFTSNIRHSEDYGSASTYPTPATIMLASERRTPNGDYSEWEEQPVVIADAPPKRTEGGYWERVKNTFTRTSAQGGRRSRTNSIGARQARDNTDSSISRESGASLINSGRMDKGDGIATFAYQQSQAVPQTTGSSPASLSVLSLAPYAMKGGVSPMPAASNADLQKYMDAKLFPFPGMMDLEKQRSRKVFNSVSSPDIVLGLDQPAPSSGSSTTRSPEMQRDRKLSHQLSDSRLLTKYTNVHSPPILSAAPSSSSTDYFSIPSPHSAVPVTPTLSGSSSLKLPTTREGVKKWLNAKKLFGSSSGTSTPNITISSPLEQVRSSETNQQPSLSELISYRKDLEVVGDLEDVGSDKSRTVTSASGSTLRGKRPSPPADATSEFRRVVDDAFGANKPNRLGNSNSSSPQNSGTPRSDLTSDIPSTAPSPPELLTSTTPDPQSSLDDFPTRSTSASLSTISSSHVVEYTRQESRGATVLDRVDELLGRGLKNPVLPFSLDDPPRKLLLSSPILQVVNANVVKDRFLFLFNDILVIVKPILQDQDSLLDSKLTILDRRFIVKSVVQLKNLRLKTERDDLNMKSHASGSMKHSLIRTFVHQFSKDPDHAIAMLFEKARTRDDPVGLGQLMFTTLDLDRVKLGDYLSRRTSKFVLKSYVDGFGFSGLRVDKALRVFLQSINIPAKSSPHFNPFEYLLEAFASRWYEANSPIVAYDKDLAVKLVRAIVQLNEVLHGGIGQEPGVTGFPKRNVIGRDFVAAFRRYDQRVLVSDELLEDIYSSVRKERLTQARNPANQGGPPDAIVTIKRGLPSRLTYRVQSEPIILRIPQPDAQLNIQFFGQDLTFDPPVLNFAKSPEASFRVTGTSLGPKTIIMWRSGANALCYSGLPLSSAIVVERAFMRNTFQIAFADVQGEKRRYMFSVDDPVLRHQWAMSLKRQVDVASSNFESAVSDPGTSKFHLATESLVFKVLQESLLGEDSDRSQFNGSFSMSMSASSSQPQSINSNAKLYRFDSHKGMGFGSSLHARSKSRSQVYHQSMAGKMEVDLEVPIDDEIDVGDISIQPQRIWRGQDIELVCRQNSCIASLLSHLHVASPAVSSQDLS